MKKLLAPIIVSLFSAAVGAQAPDLQIDAAFAEAKLLAEAGKHEEALQKYLWLYEPASEMHLLILPDVLAGWAKLGKDYPKARQALIDLRDANSKQLEAQPDDLGRGLDIVAMDRALEQPAKTVELFKLIHQKDRAQAMPFFRIVEDLLFKAGEFTLYSSMINDPKASLRTRIGIREMRLKMAPGGGYGAAERAIAEERFVDEVCKLVTVLVADHRDAEAANVRETALETRGDAAMREALDRAAADGTSAREKK